MSEGIVWAVKNGDLESLKTAMTGKDVNAEVMNGRTSIHFAADYGQLEVLQYLVEQGANIDLADKYGITPILAAIFEDHKSCVTFLLSKGAKTANLKAPDGSSYYDSASSQEMKSILKA